jgi:hypothetical protein
VQTGCPAVSAERICELQIDDESQCTNPGIHGGCFPILRERASASPCGRNLGMTATHFTVVAAVSMSMASMCGVDDAKTSPTRTAQAGNPLT